MDGSPLYGFFSQPGTPPAPRGRLPELHAEKPMRQAFSTPEDLHGAEDPLLRGHSKLYQRRREIEAELRSQFNLPEEVLSSLGGRRLPNGFGLPPPVPKPRASRSRLPAIPKPGVNEVHRPRWGAADEPAVSPVVQKEEGPEPWWKQEQAELHSRQGRSPEPLPASPPAARASPVEPAVRNWRPPPAPSWEGQPVPIAPVQLERADSRMSNRPMSWRQTPQPAAVLSPHAFGPEEDKASRDAEEPVDLEATQLVAPARNEPWRLKAKELEEIARAHRRRHEEAQRQREARNAEMAAADAESQKQYEEEQARKRRLKEERIREQRQREEQKFEELKKAELRRIQHESEEANRRREEQEEWEAKMRQHFAEEERKHRLRRAEEMAQPDPWQHEFRQERRESRPRPGPQLSPQPGAEAERQEARPRASPNPRRGSPKQQRSSPTPSEAFDPPPFAAPPRPQEPWRPPPSANFPGTAVPPGGPSNPRGQAPQQAQAGRRQTSVPAPSLSSSITLTRLGDQIQQAKATAMRQLLSLKQHPGYEARQKGFKELLRAWHPDKNPQNVEIATAVFQMLQAERRRVLDS